MSKFRSRLAAARTSRLLNKAEGHKPHSSSTLPLSQRPTAYSSSADPKPMSAERAAIREANARMLAQMSAAELQETWESAQQMLSSTALHNLAQRASNGSAAEPAAESQGASQLQGDSMPHQVNVSSLASHEQVVSAASSLAAGERAKLAWTGMVPHTSPPPSESEPPLAGGQYGSQAVGWLADSSEGGRDPAWQDSVGVRFDLGGAVVEQGAASAPYRQELHHHGDDPDSAGYTLRELVGLSRSSVPGQRCLALQALGGVLRRRRGGIVATYCGVQGATPPPVAPIVPPRLPKALVVVVRAGLDDAHLPTVQASVAALSALSAAPEDKAWSRDAAVASGALGATLPPPALAPQGQAALPFFHQRDSASSAAAAAAAARKLDEEGVSGGGDAPPTGSEPMQLAGRALRDAWAGLAATGTVARLGGMLTFPSLAPAGSATHEGVLACLTAAVRAEPSVAHAVVHMRTASKLGPLKPALTRTVAEGGAIDGAMHPHSPLGLAWHSVTAKPTTQAHSTRQAATAILPVLHLSVAVALSGASAAAAIGDSLALETLTAWVARAHAVACDGVSDVLAPDGAATLRAALHCLQLWRCALPHSRAARGAVADMWQPLLRLARLAPGQDEVAVHHLQGAVAWLIAEHFQSTGAAAVALATSPDDGDSDEEGGAGGGKAIPQAALGFTNDASTDQLVPFQRWAVHVIAEAAAGSAAAAALLPPAVSIVTAMLAVPPQGAGGAGAPDTTAATDGAVAAAWRPSLSQPGAHAAALAAAGHPLRHLQRSGTAQDELRGAVGGCLGGALGALLRAAGDASPQAAAAVELWRSVTPPASLPPAALSAELATLAGVLAQSISASATGRPDADRGVALAVNPASVCTPAHYSHTALRVQALMRMAELLALPGLQGQLDAPGADLRAALQPLPAVFRVAADTLSGCVPGQERDAHRLISGFLCHAGVCRAVTAALVGGASAMSLSTAHGLRLPMQGVATLPPLGTLHALCHGASEALCELAGAKGGVLRRRGGGLPRPAAGRYNTACEQLREARAIAFGRHMAAAGRGDAAAELPLSGHGVLQQGFEGGVVGLPLPQDMHWAAWSLAASAHAAWIQDSATTPEAERTDGFVPVGRSGSGGTQDGVDVGGSDPSARLDGAMWFLSLLHCTWEQEHGSVVPTAASPLHGQGVFALLSLVAVRPQVLAPPRLALAAAALAGQWSESPPPGAATPPSGLDAEDAAYWRACGADMSLVAQNAAAAPGGVPVGCVPVRMWVWLARYYMLLPAVLSRFAQQGMGQPLASSMATLAFLPGWDVFVSGEHIPEDDGSSGAGAQASSGTPRLRSLPGVNSAGAPSVGTLAWDLLVSKGRLGSVLVHPVLPPHPAAGHAAAAAAGATAAAVPCGGSTLVLASALCSPPLSFSSLTPGRLVGKTLLDGVLGGVLRAPPAHCAEHEHAVYRWAVHHVALGLFGAAAVGPQGGAGGLGALPPGYRAASKHATNMALLRTVSAMRSQPAAAAFLQDILTYRAASTAGEAVCTTGVPGSAAVSGASILSKLQAPCPQHALLRALALAAAGDAAAVSQLGAAGDESALASVRAAAELLQLRPEMFCEG